MNVPTNNKNIYIVDDESVCRASGGYGIVLSKNISSLSKLCYKAAGWSSKQAILSKHTIKSITTDTSSYRQRKHALMAFFSSMIKNISPSINSTEVVVNFYPLARAKRKED